MTRAKQKPATYYRDMILSESKCVVKVEYDVIRILFYGKAAMIPSLKNRKIKGMFLPPDTKGKLQGMTLLFKHAFPRFFSFGVSPVFLYLQLMPGSRVDEDNARASINDWLEPQITTVKRGNNKGKRKDRGWGIGLVQNDKQVNGYQCHSKSLDQETDHTLIVVRDYESVKKNIIDFVGNVS